MNYNELSNKAHSNSAKHGFWGEKWSTEHCLMLVITEIGELVDASVFNSVLSMFGNGQKL